MSWADGTSLSLAVVLGAVEPEIRDQFTQLAHWLHTLHQLNIPRWVETPNSLDEKQWKHWCGRTGLPLLLLAAAFDPECCQLEDPAAVGPMKYKQ